MKLNIFEYAEMVGSEVMLVSKEEKLLIEQLREGKKWT